MLLVIITSIGSCEEAPDRNTAIFSAYLLKEFNSTIPDSLHYYILIPKMMCKGCSANTLAELDTLINNENKHYFTFISTNDKILSEDPKLVKFYQYDSHGKLDDLDLDIANVTIVKTKEQKVIFIKPIYADEKRPLSEIITF